MTEHEEKPRARSLTESAEELLHRIGYPGSLPAELAGAEIIETHISVVLLGERYVLKLKKSVCFGFIDQREPEARWRIACREIELNRRLTRGVYLGLLVFRTGAGGPSLDSLLDEPEAESFPEDLIEPGVLMRRIPAKRFWIGCS